MNAVAMESANRAYVQQTLNRLKDIATGIAPELIEETASTKKMAGENSVAKKPTTRKKATGEKKLASKTTPKAKKAMENTSKEALSEASPDEEKTA